MALKEKLKKPQQEEVQKIFDKVQGEGAPAPKPSKMTKSDEIANKEAALDEVCKEEEEEEKVDAFDLADEKDCLAKYDDAWAEATLGTKKWTDKKQALDALIEDVDTPKILPGNLASLQGVLSKLVKDSNINVSLLAVKSIGFLANGLRENFNEAGKSMCAGVLDKFREKRPQIIEETKKTMYCLLTSCSLSDLLEPITASMSHKNPSVLKETCKFVENAVRQTYIDDLQDINSDLITPLMTLTDHMDGQVRESALETLGVIKGRLGEGVVGEHFKNMKAQKLDKVNSAAETVQVTKFDRSRREEEKKKAAEAKKKAAAEKKAKEEAKRKEEEERRAAEKARQEEEAKKAPPRSSPSDPEEITMETPKDDGEDAIMSFDEEPKKPKKKKGGPPSGFLKRQAEMKKKAAEKKAAKDAKEKGEKPPAPSEQPTEAPPAPVEEEKKEVVKVESKNPDMKESDFHPAQSKEEAEELLSAACGKAIIK